ncbi:MAG: SCO family protein [Chloroflexi bacterium]|nr:SCO family protein [Chloroflexota bacterium]
MQRKIQWLSVAGLAGVIILAAVFVLTRKPAFKGVVISPPLAAAEIELTDHNGNPFRLSDHRGEVVLLYFGYINCPDDCPLTTAHLKLALEDLGARAKKVQVVMVSTDPVRDTPAGLKDFMAHFNPDFLGLTGTQAELEKVWEDYWVHVENGGETHGTSIFVIDPAGNIRILFSPESEPDDISADVNLLIKGK